MKTSPFIKEAFPYCKRRPFQKTTTGRSVDIKGHSEIMITFNKISLTQLPHLIVKEHLGTGDRNIISTREPRNLLGYKCLP